MTVQKCVIFPIKMISAFAFLWWQAFPQLLSSWPWLTKPAFGLWASVGGFNGNCLMCLCDLLFWLGHKETTDHIFYRVYQLITISKRSAGALFIGLVSEHFLSKNCHQVSVEISYYLWLDEASPEPLKTFKQLFSLAGINSLWQVKLVECFMSLEAVTISDGHCATLWESHSTNRNYRINYVSALAMLLDRLSQGTSRNTIPACAV